MMETSSFICGGLISAARAAYSTVQLAGILKLQWRQLP